MKQHLTKTERETIKLYRKGLTEIQIANKLHISEEDVIHIIDRFE